MIGNGMLLVANKLGDWKHSITNCVVIEFFLVTKWLATENFQSS